MSCKREIRPLAPNNYYNHSTHYEPFCQTNIVNTMIKHDFGKRFPTDIRLINKTKLLATEIRRNPFGEPSVGAAGINDDNQNTPM